MGASHSGGKVAMAKAQSNLKIELWSLWNALRYRMFVGEKTERGIVDAFHRLFFDAHVYGKTWAQTTWLGVPVLKSPFDLWTAQELIQELRPDVIIETGTAHGGSAFYMASLCDLIGKGRVITIDVNEDPSRPLHDRITYLRGSSTALETVDNVRRLVRPGETTLVFLDSDHRRDHVRREMEAYGGLVTRGSYLVVEDTNVNGHPIRPDFGPGPMEAVEDFLKSHEEFSVDRTREKFFLTFNPKGYLRKTG
jgi:cephalosporin hydroxylase